MRLMPRHDGWGIRASNLVSELCGLVGIKNISIKASVFSQDSLLRLFVILVYQVD
jgi:ribosomal protein S5